LKWEREIPEDYILSQQSIKQIESQVLVTSVVDGDTIKVKF